MRRYPTIRPAVTAALALLIVVESGFTGLRDARASGPGG